MSLHDDLLRQAEVLAGLDKSKPKQANLRRAISASYYALFHFLIDEGCRQVLGAKSTASSLRRIIARCFDHGSMRNACDAFAKSQFPKVVARGLPGGFSVPLGLKQVALTFVELQEIRHLADYDLRVAFRRSDVRALIEQADLAVGQFD